MGLSVRLIILIIIIIITIIVIIIVVVVVVIYIAHTSIVQGTLQSNSKTTKLSSTSNVEANSQQ